MMNKPPSPHEPDFAPEELRSPLALQRRCWELAAVRKQKMKEKNTLSEQIRLTEQYVANFRTGDRSSGNSQRSAV